LARGYSDFTKGEFAMTGLPTRVDFTESTRELLRTLYKRNGPLMFHQSGGCCDGSSPMCFPAGEFRTGGADVMLEEITVEGIAEPIRFWMSMEQFEYWKHTHLTIDVVPGRGGGFSLETTENKRFLTRSRMYTDAEWALLKDAKVLDGLEVGA
jgi:uncharacterized protein (DUF779 family)